MVRYPVKTEWYWKVLYFCYIPRAGVYGLSLQHKQFWYFTLIYWFLLHAFQSFMGPDLLTILFFYFIVIILNNELKARLD